MPANLTPQYLEAEAKFKQAKTTQEKINALEVMMAVIPKHKGTEKIRGQLKSRMAKLKEELQKRPTLGRAEQAYTVKREGSAQVVLLGLPNSGKSTLFSKVTHAFSEAADYPFTTQKPIPGMMNFENLQIQLVDTPPLQLDHIEPGFSNLIRNADALLIVVDLTEDPVFQMEVLLEELNRMNAALPMTGCARGGPEPRAPSRSGSGAPSFAAESRAFVCSFDPAKAAILGRRHILFVRNGNNRAVLPLAVSPRKWRNRRED